MNVRPQIARFRIHGLIFLFDPDGERGLHRKSGVSVARALLPAKFNQDLVRRQYRCR